MKQIWCYALLLSLLVLRFSAATAHYCNHGHDHDHDHDHHHYHHHDDVAGDEAKAKAKAKAEAEVNKRKLLPEELAEEEDLKLYGFGDGDGAHHYHHDHDHDGHKHHQASSELSGFGLWVHAMGCSLLVSLASLICLVLLPLIFVHGKPTKAVVDSLALFGAGAMLGDAFLHQLPHAFGGEHSHSHDHHMDHAHDHNSHSHSLKDLSVGLSVLAGIVLFLLVEKLVRYVEGLSGGANALTHGHHHHHHHHKHSIKQKVDSDTKENHQGMSDDDKDGSSVNTSSEGKVLDEMSGDARNGIKQSEQAVLRKRNTSTDRAEDEAGQDAPTSTIDTVRIKEEPAKRSSNLVFGYLNLFSDGVHNFTDGMALGSAFLLYGSIGGWSRTLFLLAHEIPQEIGDFGILVRSGFSVSRALFFNFLSALVALAGTALALMLGQDPGQSSLIEGFTAGGFIYIAVAGVLAEMNNDSSTSFRSTAIQLISLTLGMAVALCISLVE